MQYKDYYKILGLDKTASKEDIKKTYRKLARKFHPDVNKAADAEQKYKDINEAYEVLKDPEKRQKYDTLGSSWRDGENFTPPPGYESRSGGFENGGFGGFSDFFRTIFGGAGGFSNMEDLFQGGMSQGYGGRQASMRGQDAEAELQLSLEDAYRGGSTSISLESYVQTGDGRVVPKRRTLKVNIPKGVTEGTRLKLAGKGNPGMGGSPAGDLFLTIRIAKHPDFELRGHDLVTEGRISPWEAALGADIPVKTMDGSVNMKLPAGTQSGQMLRLKGKGMPKKGGKSGDLLLRIKILVPKSLTADEKKLFQELSKTSSFSARG